MDELHLACAARGRYVEHSATMLRSVLVNADGLAVRVHYLCEPELSDGHATAITAMVEDLGGSISFLAIDEEQVRDLPSQPEFTTAMWYRILLPELLPLQDRVLYLDIDTLVVDSLDPLWRTDLSGSYVAAVSNVFQHNHAHRPAELGLPPSQSYFNSGVLLMNLDQMRRDDCASRVRKCAASRAVALEWPDQDALNLVLGDRRVSLHPRWNCMNSIVTLEASVDEFGAALVEEARSRPAIRHFEGPGANKPWHYLCDLDGREAYLEQREQTPWPPRPEGRSLRNVARRTWRRVAGTSPGSRRGAG